MKYPTSPLTPSVATLPEHPLRSCHSHSSISHPAKALTCTTSIVCRLLKSLGSLFEPAVVCFQRLAASFRKTPGVAYPRTAQSAPPKLRKRTPAPPHLAFNFQLSTVDLPITSFPATHTKSVPASPLPATHPKNRGVGLVMVNQQALSLRMLDAVGKEYPPCHA